MTKQETITKLLKIEELYHSGKLGEVTHEVYPKLEKNERLNYLYFTLAPAINFQRDSKRMWQSAFETFMDPETTFVFDPLITKNKSRKDIQSALVKHRLALLTEKHTDIWIKISNKLASEYAGDPANLIEANRSDVPTIIEYLRVNKTDFPYLNGPKMSNYWLYILHQFTDVKLKNIQDISIIPDTHIKKASVILGLTKSNTATPEEVELVWKNLLEDTEYMPMQFHAPMWRWSKNKFEPNLEQLTS
ncbi:hypothetical protein KC909_02140 [Candidatus Dojkabacteria bacterium]|uniref:Uncharacterized protein n=1 Tax=Candidatus Dojkabacteria bacterium TaxID=2099670 RepID=A0A955RIQ6_9BACT|nr:hypothetical protein [Candidatus Dojkabacteria bacterium]